MTTVGAADSVDGDTCWPLHLMTDAPMRRFERRLRLHSADSLAARPHDDRTRVAHPGDARCRVERQKRRRRSAAARARFSRPVRLERSALRDRRRRLRDRVARATASMAARGVIEGEAQRRGHERRSASSGWATRRTPSSSFCCSSPPSRSSTSSARPPPASSPSSRRPRRRGGLGAADSLARWWYAVVSQPFFLFVFARWFWEWFLWALTVASLARIGMTLRARHPDRSGGVAFLESPLWGFQTFVLGIGCALAASWAQSDRSDRRGGGDARQLLPRLPRRVDDARGRSLL